MASRHTRDWKQRSQNVHSVTDWNRWSEHSLIKIKTKMRRLNDYRIMSWTPNSHSISNTMHVRHGTDVKKTKTESLDSNAEKRGPIWRPKTTVSRLHHTSPSLVTLVFHLFLDFTMKSAISFMFNQLKHHDAACYFRAHKYVMNHCCKPMSVSSSYTWTRDQWC